MLTATLAKANSDERRDFVNEIDMMKKVAKGNNTHVVGLLGCVTLEEPLCLVTEYYEYGDLQSYLHTIKKEVRRKNGVICGMYGVFTHLLQFCCSLS